MRHPHRHCSTLPQWLATTDQKIVCQSDGSWFVRGPGKLDLPRFTLERQSPRVALFTPSTGDLTYHVSRGTGDQYRPGIPRNRF